MKLFSIGAPFRLLRFSKIKVKPEWNILSPGEAAGGIFSPV